MRCLREEEEQMLSSPFLYRLIYVAAYHEKFVFLYFIACSQKLFHVIFLLIYFFSIFGGKNNAQKSSAFYWLEGKTFAPNFYLISTLTSLLKNNTHFWQHQQQNNEKNFSTKFHFKEFLNKIFTYFFLGCCDVCRWRKYFFPHSIFFPFQVQRKKNGFICSMER